MTAGVEIRRASLPLPQGAAQPQQFDLVELVAATVPATAVAIVLDLSDSAGSMQALLARLPMLLAKLPRKWPVWIYCLSNPAQIVLPEPVNVGHLIDGGLDLSSVLTDRVLRQTAAGCGSFAGPVIESIHERRAIESLEEAIVILITDGRLTDFSSVNVLPGIRLIGLTDTPDKSSDKIWRSAFPNHPLFRLSEPDLDVWIEANRAQSPCLFHVTLRGEGVALARLLNKDESLQPADTFDWNSGAGPCQLLVPSATADTFDVLMNSSFGGSQIRLAVANVRSRPSAEAIAAASATLVPSSTDRSILIDAAAGDSNFDVLWAAAAAMARCCDMGSQWKDSIPEITPILKRLKENRQYQAALCVCRGDPRHTHQRDSRMVVIGVRLGAGTAIGWLAGQSTPFGVPAQNWRLRYDKMEGRWIHSHGSEEETELRPQGGQCLAPLKLRNESLNIFFSGTL